MIPKRKPVPANRATRRAQDAGRTKSRVKSGGPKPPSGLKLAEALARTIAANDATVTRNDGVMGGEKGVVFHRTAGGKSVFAYAVTAGKSRVTLHAMPMYSEPKVHAAFKARVAGGDFGKGCILFKPDATVDLNVIAELIRACAKVSL